MRRIVIAALLATPLWTATSQARYLHKTEARRAALAWARDPAATARTCTRSNAHLVVCYVHMNDGLPWLGRQGWNGVWTVSVVLRHNKPHAYNELYTPPR